MVLFLGVGGIGNGKEKVPRTMEFESSSMYVAPSNSPNLYIYVLYYVLNYIISLCSGGFVDVTADMCWFGVWWVHGTIVSRTGCSRLGSTTRRVSFYASLVGTHKYIGHEIAKWWGWCGRRSEHCRRCW